MKPLAQLANEAQNNESLRDKMMLIILNEPPSIFNAFFEDCFMGLYKEAKTGKFFYMTNEEEFAAKATFVEWCEEK